MQKRSYGQFMNRALAYSALAILDQSCRKWDYDFNKVYFVGILNYIHFPERSKPFTYVALQTTDDHTITNDGITPLTPQIDQLLSQLGAHSHGVK
jgi:hypothetical protein